MSQRHTTAGIARINLILRRCPVMDCCGENGAGDELPLRCGEIDESEVARGKRVAVRLLCADAPHPRPQESDGLRRVASYEIEDVVGHPASVTRTIARASAVLPSWGRRSRWIDRFRRAP